MRIQRVVWLKAASVLFTANIVTMLAMNTLVLRSKWFALVYAMALMLAMVLVRAARLPAGGESELALSRTDKRILWIGGLVLFLAYALPRAGYLAECGLGYVVDPVCWDDRWHFLELNSLVNSPRYPAISAIDPRKYLSFYYAPWMLVVFIHQLVPFGWMTIKAAYFVGYSIYIALTLGLVFYAIARLAASRRRFWFLLYTIVLYAGAESVLAVIDPADHHEWWMRQYGLNIQLSSFSTLALWVVHHLSAGLALLVAYFIYRRPGLRRSCSLVLQALLLAYAFYSSVFVFIGAVPFMAFLGIRDLASRRFGLCLVEGLSGLFVLPILWLYLGKEPGFILLENLPYLAAGPLNTGSLMLNLLVCFAIFLAAMGLELMLQVVLLAQREYRCGLSRPLRVALGLSVAYLLSLFFVSYAGSNNWAMRGAVVPVWVIGYCVSVSADRIRFSRAVIFILALLALGSVNEIGMFERVGFDGVLTKPKNLGARRTIYQLNSRRDVKIISPGVLRRQGIPDDVPLYLVEKIVLGHGRPLSLPDRETINDGPFGPWRYQNWRQRAEGESP